MLRYPIFFSLDHTVCDLVAQLVQCCYEVRENALFRKLWHVLHGDIVWHDLSGKPTELREKPPVLVTLAMLLVLAMRRERLAWCATDEHFDVKVLEALLNLLARDLTHVLTDEGALAVICLVGVLAGIIEIITGNDINATGAEAVSEPADTAEKVNSPDGRAVVTLGYVSSLVYVDPLACVAFWCFRGTWKSISRPNTIAV